VVQLHAGNGLARSNVVDWNSRGAIQAADAVGRGDHSNFEGF